MVLNAIDINPKQSTKNAWILFLLKNIISNLKGIMERVLVDFFLVIIQIKKRRKINLKYKV